MEPHDRIEAISRLALLRDQGVLTPEEFAQEKRKVLSSSGSALARWPVIATVAAGVAATAAALWLFWPAGNPARPEIVATTQQSDGATATPPASPTSVTPEPAQKALASSEAPGSAPVTADTARPRKCGNLDRIGAAIARLQAEYGDVDAGVECGVRALNIIGQQIICKDQHLWTMSILDTMAWVYSIENATGVALDHSKPNLYDYDSYREFAAQRDACRDDQCVCNVLMGPNGGVAGAGLGSDDPYYGHDE